MNRTQMLNRHTAPEDFLTSVAWKVARRLGAKVSEYHGWQRIEAKATTVYICTTKHVPDWKPSNATRSVPVIIGVANTTVGPWLTSAAPCLVCWSTRRRLAGNLDEVAEQAEVEWWDEVATEHPRLVDDALADMIADAVNHVCGDSISSSLGTLLKIAHTTLQITKNRFLKDPICPACATLPEDSRAGAEIILPKSAKPHPRSYRIRSATADLLRLKAAYVDKGAGIIHALKRDTQGGLAVAAAIMTLRRHNWKEPGFGRSRNYEESEATAILEALERYGGVQPGGKKTVVRATYKEIAEEALDPRELGVHPASTYRNPAQPYRSFGEDVSTKWVWGWSLTVSRPILVPETAAYYYVALDSNEPPFTAEVSNGCALGGSLTEAIFHALLEVAERDAFLMTWFAKLPIPELNVSSSVDNQLRLQVSLLENETGYRIRLFDQTSDNGIPSVWAKAEVGDIRGRSSLPATVCAAGAHPSLEHAALAAVSELGPFLRDFIDRFPSLADEAEAMVDDRSLVRAMADHATLYGSPRAASWLEFLDRGERTDFADAPGAGRHFENENLSDDVLDMVRRFKELGQNVIVIDQTTDEHRMAELNCVKVLVTGSLTMTFGHSLRRIDGVPRLNAAREANGLSARESNEHVLPHPFP